MKIIFAMNLALLGSLSLPLLANAIPSNLSNCQLNGWETQRLGKESSLKFRGEAPDCVARFEIRSDHAQINDGWRAELADPLRLPVGSSATYEFSTLIPSNLKNPRTPNLVFAQWHDNKVPGVKAQRPPFSIRLRDGFIDMPLFNQAILNQQGENGPGVSLYRQPAVFDRWIQWRVKTYWAVDNRGSIQVWKDGKLIVNYRGIVGYPSDPTAPYFKIGIYTTQAFDRPLRVFHAKFRRTYSNALR